MNLAKYDAACRAVAEAKTVDEAKDLRDKAEAMRAYARQAKNRQLEVDTAEIRMRAERRLGEIIKLQKETVGLNTGTAGKGRPNLGGSDEVPPKNERPTLAEGGIDKKLSMRAQKLAAVPGDKFEGMLGEWRERVSEETERVTVNLLKEGESHVRGTFGTGENEWYTPKRYIELARDALGGIDLDPASSVIAQKTVRAKSYFTVENDALSREWQGSVWLNPPYAQPKIEHFVDKLLEEINSERVSKAILLTHNYTDTAWFQKAAEASHAICFTKGRVRFEAADGTIAAPTQGQAFFLLGCGCDVTAFHRAFHTEGFMVVSFADQ